MRFLITFFMVMIVVMAASGLYVLKHKVETRREMVRALERQIVEDSEAIRVLEAEWAYLSSPAAIRERALRHLRLAPVASSRILPSPAGLPYRLDRRDVADAAAGDVRRLPEPRLKPRVPDSAASKAVAAAAGGSRDTASDFAARIRLAIARGGGE